MEYLKPSFPLSSSCCLLSALLSWLLFLPFYTALFPQSKGHQFMPFPLFYIVQLFFFFFVLRIKSVIFTEASSKPVPPFSAVDAVFPLCCGHTDCFSVPSVYWACSSCGAFALAVSSEGICPPTQDLGRLPPGSLGVSLKVGR